MVQRNSLYRQRTVFIDNLLLRRIHLPEVHFVIHIATEHIHLPARHVYQFAGGIYRQSGRPAQQPESAQHAYQSEAVVTMQV